MHPPPLITATLLCVFGLNWESPPTGLAGYLGQVEPQGETSCLGFFRSRTEFVAPATCLVGKQAMHVLKADATSQLISKFSTDQEARVVSHKFWDRSHPHVYNAAVLADEFQGGVEVADPRIHNPIQAGHASRNEFVVVRFAGDLRPEARRFEQTVDSDCHAILLGEDGIGLEQQEFSRDQFCAQERSWVGQEPLTPADVGAPAFVADQASPTIAGIYNQAVVHNATTFYFFTKVNGLD